MTNKYLPHILVLPEDDANRQMANGFLLHPSVKTQRVQILEEAGGWGQVLERFRSDHVHAMERYPLRRMVLLIDFDGQENRLERAREAVPSHLSDRVFILGVWTEPERLRADLGALESIGMALAKDCHERTSEVWAHSLLVHNRAEVARMQEQVREIYF